MAKRNCYNGDMTEQEFNKRRAAALLAAAHVCPDKLRKVQMLYEAGELMQAANPYGCNQYGHGWKQAHNGISSKKAPKGGSGGKKDEETEKPADQSKKPTKQPNKKPQNKKPTQAPKSPSKPTKAPVPSTQPVAPSKPTYAPQQPKVPGQTPANLKRRASQRTRRSRNLRLPSSRRQRLRRRFLQAQRRNHSPPRFPPPPPCSRSRRHRPRRRQNNRTKPLPRCHPVVQKRRCRHRSKNLLHRCRRLLS